MVYLSYAKCRYKGKHLWLTVLRVNREMVVGRVWNHPINPGLLFCQLLQIPIHGILNAW